MIWFTADHHFGHQNIIKYCNRSFSNGNEMDREQVQRHNKVVSDGDIVYFVGDLTLSNNFHWVSRIVRSLKGIKILILGNHDDFNPFTYVKMGFVSVHTALEKDNFVLVHDPATSCIDRSRTFLCGHIHDLFKVQKNVINVGVDVWDFYPVSLDQILEIKDGKTNMS